VDLIAGFLTIFRAPVEGDRTCYSRAIPQGHSASFNIIPSRFHRTPLRQRRFWQKIFFGFGSAKSRAFRTSRLTCGRRRADALADFVFCAANPAHRWAEAVPLVEVAQWHSGTVGQPNAQPVKRKTHPKNSNGLARIGIGDARRSRKPLSPEWPSLNPHLAHPR